MLLWAHRDGIFAVAHVRGGGELGDQWHKGGFKTTKPNTWKDLIACAEYLVTQNYTSPKKISIYSASAGGILIGRAMTERPDLFAAAIPEVGCLNTLRGEESPNTSDKPILFWTDFEAGHGIGNTKTKAFESLADVLSFSFWQTGHPDFQIK
jgi:protease II